MFKVKGLGRVPRNVKQGSVVGGFSQRFKGLGYLFELRVLDSFLRIL